MGMRGKAGTRNQVQLPRTEFSFSCVQNSLLNHSANPAAFGSRTSVLVLLVLPVVLVLLVHLVFLVPLVLNLGPVLRLSQQVSTGDKGWWWSLLAGGGSFFVETLKRAVCPSHSPTSLAPPPPWPRPPPVCSLTFDTRHLLLQGASFILAFVQINTVPTKLSSPICPPPLSPPSDP